MFLIALCVNIASMNIASLILRLWFDRTLHLLSSCGGPGGSDISGGYREKGQVIDDGCDKQTHVACLCYISVAFFALLFVVVAEEEKCLAIVWLLLEQP